jgi:hypothetical protein
MTELIIDTKPYCPDIFFENEKCYTNDNINTQKLLPISSTIFIVNLNAAEGSTDPRDTIYNDIKYMLYGDLSNYDQTTAYYPSFYFFKTDELNSIKIIYKSQVVTSELSALLDNIGYTIEENNYNNSFSYREIEIYDSVGKKYRTVIFIYFIYDAGSATTTDYNLYKDVIYHKNANWNVLIYPFIDSGIPEYCKYDHRFNYDFVFNSTNLIQTINFDDRENISFIKKLDFKYFENQKTCISKSKLMNCYANYMKNNKFFLEHVFKSDAILISSNEIGKIHNNQLSNNSINSDYINKKHINKYNTFSASINKYLMSFDSKISYFEKLKNKNINSYNCYNYDIGVNNSLYETNKNYQIDGFIDINTENNKRDDEMLIINQYLRQTYMIINPYIIDSTYLTTCTQYKIKSIKTDQNIFTINNTDDCTMGFLNYPSNIEFSETCYLNYYEIEFTFKDYKNYQNNEDNNLFTFTIILKILFYNSINVTIQNLTNTQKSNDLAFIIFQELNKEFGMCPCLSNYSKNNIYEIDELYKFNDVKYYNFLLNYDSESNYKYNDNMVSYYNFYFSISNIKQPSNVGGLYNMNIQKINNYIKNILNVNNNFSLFYHNISKNYLLLSTVYDNTINKELIRIKTIKAPELTFEDEKYNKLTVIPRGKYVIFRYTNMIPEYIITEISQENDEYVKNINSIEKFLKNDFSLLIKIPDNYKINSFVTKCYLVCNLYDDLYLYNEKYFLGLELFDFEYMNLKFVLNMFYGNYMNFNTLNIIIPFYNEYTESNAQIIDIDNTIFKLHNNDKINNILTCDYERFLQRNIVNEEYNTYMKLGEYYITSITSSDVLFTDINTFYIINELYIYNNESDFANIFYIKKMEEDNLILNSKRLMFIFNTRKIIELLGECNYYLNIIKYSSLLDKMQTSQYFDYINNNAKNIIGYMTYNYNLNITYSVTESSVLLTFNKLIIINSNSNLEEINILIMNTDDAIIYENIKQNIIKNDVLKYINIIETKINVYYKNSFFIDIAANMRALLLRMNTNFHNSMKLNIDNFINSIKPNDILNLGLFNINEDGIDNTNSFTNVKPNTTLNKVTKELKNSINIEKCNDIYLLLIHNYLKYYFYAIYLSKTSVQNEHNIIDYISTFISLFENIGTSILDGIIEKLKTLLELFIKYNIIVNNVNETQYNFDNISSATLTELSENVCEIETTLLSLKDEIPLSISILNNNSFNDFYNYAHCFNINSIEFVTMNLIKIKLIEAISLQSDNKIINLLQIYHEEFFSFVVFFNFINKALYEYKKDKTVDLKILIINTLETMNDGENTCVQSVLNNIKNDIDTKITMLSELIIDGDVPSDYLVAFELITSQNVTFDTLIVLKEIEFITKAIKAISDTNNNIYINFITKEKDSYNGNIINILNYKYISNPYINLNITNTEVFV